MTGAGPDGRRTARSRRRSGTGRAWAVSAGGRPSRSNRYRRRGSKAGREGDHRTEPRTKWEGFRQGSPLAPHIGSTSVRAGLNPMHGATVSVPRIGATRVGDGVGRHVSGVGGPSRGARVPIDGRHNAGTAARAARAASRGLRAPRGRAGRGGGGGRRRLAGGAMRLGGPRSSGASGRAGPPLRPLGRAGTGARRGPAEGPEVRSVPWRAQFRCARMRRSVQGRRRSAAISGGKRSNRGGIGRLQEFPGNAWAREGHRQANAGPNRARGSAGSCEAPGTLGLGQAEHASRGGRWGVRVRQLEHARRAGCEGARVGGGRDAVDAAAMPEVRVLLNVGIDVRGGLSRGHAGRRAQIGLAGVHQSERVPGLDVGAELDAGKAV